MSDKGDTAFQRKLGITRGGTYLSLGVVISIVVMALAVVGWVNGMDEARGKELHELDKRLTRVETKTEDMFRLLEKIDQKLDTVQTHLMNQ